MGEARMEIELLLGSRGRPRRFGAMVQSALLLAAHPELLLFRVRVDEDDPELPFYRRMAAGTEEFGYRKESRIVLHIGPRIPVPQLTAQLARACESDLMMLGCSDDILFRTQGWDAKVCEVFASYPDGLVVAATDDADGRPYRKCQHFFTTRRWLEVVGFEGWPELEHFGIDHWHERVAVKAGRMLYLDVVAEHMHMKHRYPDGKPKSQNDETYRAKRRKSEDGSSPSDRDIARLTAGEVLMNEQAARVRARLRA